jgi:2-hydroxymuconate-semialdehyde hydrolase
MQDYKNALTDFIRQDLLHGRAVKLDEELDLLSAGVIDSLGILRMVAFMEERFGVKVPDEDVVFENFQNIRVMAEYIAQRKPAVQPQ